MKNNQISDRGAKLIAKAMAKNESLHLMNFAGNHLTPDSAADLVQAAFDKEYRFRSINLQNNQNITKESLLERGLEIDSYTVNVIL